MFINKDEAQALAQAFRTAHPHQPHSFNLPLALAQSFLYKPGVDSVRIYLGQTPEGKIDLVFSAVDANGNDIPGDATATPTAEATELGLTSTPYGATYMAAAPACPPDCKGHHPHTL